PVVGQWASAAPAARGSVRPAEFLEDQHRPAGRDRRLGSVPPTPGVIVHIVVHGRAQRSPWRHLDRPLSRACAYGGQLPYPLREEGNEQARRARLRAGEPWFPRFPGSAPEAHRKLGVSMWRANLPMTADGMRQPLQATAVFATDPALARR